jgi:hypothetical protein
MKFSYIAGTFQKKKAFFPINVKVIYFCNLNFTNT